MSWPAFERSIKQSCHIPSFIWGAGMMAAIGGLALGQWTYATCGLVGYGIGWLLLRWQPTYGTDRAR